MSERAFGGGGFEGGGGERVSHMVDGQFYDLRPPSVNGAGTFTRVQCEYQVPNHPNEYVVKGIPEGGTEPKSFVLRFTDRGVSATVAEDQEFAASTPQKPSFHVIKGGKSN